MEVIVFTIVVSAIITFFIAKHRKPLIIPAYILLNLIINLMFFIGGYISNGYIDPFWPIAHFNITLVTLLGSLIGHFFCDLFRIRRDYSYTNAFIFSDKLVHQIALFNPSAFILLAVSVYVTSRLLTHDFPFALNLAEAILVAILIGWHVISTRFLLNICKNPMSAIKEKYKRIVLCYFGVLIIPLSLILGQGSGVLVMHEGQGLTETASYHLLWVMFLLCILYIIWSSANIFVYAADETKTSVSNVFFIAIQLLFLPVFIYPLNKRLKRISSHLTKRSLSSP